MAYELTLKRNDLQPYLYLKAIESTGTVIDLTGATIRATMKRIDDGTLKINRQTAGVTITSATTGLFQYQWQSATSTSDTNTTGAYTFEFEITPGSGGKFTLPVNQTLRVNIIPDDDAT